jgi:hypothetical protein
MNPNHYLQHHLKIEKAMMAGYHYFVTLIAVDEITDNIVRYAEDIT